MYGSKDSCAFCTSNFSSPKTVHCLGTKIQVLSLFLIEVSLPRNSPCFLQLLTEQKAPPPPPSRKKNRNEKVEEQGEQERTPVKQNGGSCDTEFVPVFSVVRLSLYCEMQPQIEIRPNLFICLMTVSENSPPTLGKHTVVWKKKKKEKSGLKKGRRLRGKKEKPSLTAHDQIARWIKMLTVIIYHLHRLMDGSVFVFSTNNTMTQQKKGQITWKSDVET